jgi:hypothetical protein
LYIEVFKKNLIMQTQINKIKFSISIPRSGQNKKNILDRFISKCLLTKQYIRKFEKISINFKKFNHIS